MRIIEDSGFFSDVDVDEIIASVDEANICIAPYKETGEIIIDRIAYGREPELALHLQLDDGPGKSCAARKCDTLIAHSEVVLTGQLDGILTPEEKADGMVSWYGGMRVAYAIFADDGDILEVGDLLINFSDRKEWQDQLYIEAIYCAIESSDDLVVYRNEKTIDADPVAGTAKIVWCRVWES